MRQISGILIAAVALCYAATAKTMTNQASEAKPTTSFMEKSDTVKIKNRNVKTVKTKPTQVPPSNAPATYPNNPTTNPNPSQINTVDPSNPINHVNPVNPTAPGSPANNQNLNSPVVPPVNPANPATSPINPAAPAVNPSTINPTTTNPATTNPATTNPIHHQ